MKRKKMLGATLVFIAGVSAVVIATKTTALASPPPLLDREVFFGNPAIAGAKISPDGKSLAFLQPYKGVMNIFVTAIDEPFSKGKPLTMVSDRPISSFAWSRDSKHLLYGQDQGGNENFHLFSVDVEHNSPSLDLSPFSTVRAEVLDLPKEAPSTVYVAMNDRDERYHDVYAVDMISGQRTLLRQNDQEFAEILLDLQGNPKAAIKTTPDGRTQLLRLSNDRVDCVVECEKNESILPVAFHPDGKRLYLCTNRGQNVDLARFVLFDIETGEEEILDVDPEQQVDFDHAVFSNKTDVPIASIFMGDRSRIYWKDIEWKHDYDFLKKQFPDSDIVITSMTNDDSIFTFAVTSDIDPGSVYLYDRPSHTTRFLYQSRPALPSEHLAKMEPFSFVSRDGKTIHGYLSLPRNFGNNPMSLVVLPHGGPWARDYWGYQGMVQFLVNRGYAVVQINFRGSTGYGKNFLRAGNKEWGDAMQNDITDGVLYLIKKGVADPRRVAIYGGSYGGYATLAGLAFTPDLYAAGISYVGPSNLLTLLKSFPAYWASGKGQMDERVGDPNDPADRERLRRQSPLFSAHNIKAPLLVVQGANDPRVKKAESDQIVEALYAMGRDVEYIVAPDEGHGFISPENRLALSVAIEHFLAKHLGGRCQETVPEETAHRLDAITVDVSTVHVR